MYATLGPGSNAHALTENLEFGGVASGSDALEVGLPKVSLSFPLPHPRHSWELSGF